MIGRSILSAAVLVTTLIMCQLVATLEAHYKPTFAAINKADAFIKASQSPDIPRKTVEKVEQASKDVDVLRNSFLMLWVCGGIFPGAVVGVILRKATKAQIALDMGVSVCTALPVTPYLLRRYTDCTPEECFLGGFILSVGAWALWQIILVLVARIISAADKRGIAGVKDEILGGGEKKP